MDKDTLQILIVEDDDIDRAAVRRFIKNENMPYQLYEAESLYEAERLLNEQVFDAILLDYNLNDGTGIELLPLTGSTPVIFVTGNGSEENAVKAMRSGADDYLVKDHGRKYLKLLFVAIENALARRKAEAAQKESEEKFYKLFQSSSVVMVIASAEEGRIIDANQSVFNITGFTREEMIGRTTLELNLYPDLEEREELRRRVLTHGSVSDYELTIRTKSGELRCGMFSFDLIKLEGQLCVLAVASDITRRKQAEDKLRESYREQAEQKQVIEKKTRDLEEAKGLIEEKAHLVEEASRHKSEFLASMSHELRTPLNSIILLSEILARNKEGNLSEKEVEYADIIKTSGRDLLELINDILDISKVESGRMEVNPTRLSFEYLCRKIEGYFMEMASVKGLDFLIKKAPGVPVEIVTDAQKLEQIIKNLISNAMKFTEKGTVRFIIHRPDASADLSGIGLDGLDPAETIAFSVCDTGIGIAEDELDYVFETFRQSSSSISKGYGGTGLGLPISKVFAQLLGGDILVESMFGKGTTFTLCLPEKLFREPQARTPENLTGNKVEEHNLDYDEEVKSILDDTKILIVDDDMRSTYSLISSFDLFNTELIVGADGNKCMEKLEENPDTDLVILDLVMPDKDGYQVLGEIRSQKRFQGIPVIVLTANADPDDSEKCLDAGADDYMTKPVDIQTLLSKVAALIKQTRGPVDGGAMP